MAKNGFKGKVTGRSWTCSLLNERNDIPRIIKNIKSQISLGRIAWASVAEHNEDKYIQEEVDAFMKKAEEKRQAEAPNKTLEEYISDNYDDIPEVDKPKKKHTHFLIYYTDEKTASAACKIALGKDYVKEYDFPSSLFEKVADREDMYLYLTHTDSASKALGKHVYPESIRKNFGKIPFSQIGYATTKESKKAILHRVAYEGLSIEEAEELIGGDDLTAKDQSDLRTKRDFYIKHVRKIPEYRNLTVFWDIGESGTSKSFSTKNELLQKFPSDVYCLDDRKNDLTSGFDKYDYETHLIIDDFKGDIRYTDLLTTIMNPYAQQLHCRGTGNNKFACWTQINFTSVLLPCEMYQGMVARESDCQYDSLEQFERRILPLLQ
ncbi:MAG: hypothetical protein IK121_00655 [Lachnospiraceae bacterium]|nr:hypothetical protein [Lachnospiraceae bacterium]